MSIPNPWDRQSPDWHAAAQTPIAQKKNRGISEADTVTLVKDVLSDALGYDKYTELTSEHGIRGTYCDLAVKFDDKLAQLIEVKAIGIELADRHVKQAINDPPTNGRGSGQSHFPR